MDGLNINSSIQSPGLNVDSYSSVSCDCLHVQADALLGYMSQISHESSI